MLTAALLTALVLVLACALTAWTARTRQLRRRLDAAPRVAQALRELAEATADWDTAVARAQAVLTAQATTPTGGFGDAHVVPARLRAALARIEQDQS